VLRLLCLPLALSLIAGCGNKAEIKPHAQKPNEAQEMFQVEQATKNNPSLELGSNQAGAPLHFDPYPKPKPPGMTHDEHAHHDMAKH
jgi:hypothetical protein